MNKIAQIKSLVEVIEKKTGKKVMFKEAAPKPGRKFKRYLDNPVIQKIIENMLRESISEIKELMAEEYEILKPLDEKTEHQMLIIRLKNDINENQWEEYDLNKFDMDFIQGSEIFSDLIKKGFIAKQE